MCSYDNYTNHRATAYHCLVMYCIMQQVIVHQGKEVIKVATYCMAEGSPGAKVRVHTIPALENQPHCMTQTIRIGAQRYIWDTTTNMSNNHNNSNNTESNNNESVVGKPPLFEHPKFVIL